MPPSPNDTISIPAIGLTFTPVEAPKPVTVQPRGLSTFGLGDRVVSSFTPHGAQYIVIGRADGSGLLLLSVSNVNRYYDVSMFINKDSFYHVDDIDANGKPKTIHAAAPSLVPFRDLPQGAVFKAHGSEHLTRLKTDGSYIWWNVGNGNRPSTIYTASDFDSCPVFGYTLCELLGHINK